MAKINDTKKAVAKTQIKTVWDFFRERKNEIAQVLPSHITPDRLIGVMSYVIKSTPAVMQASQISLISAVIQTVQIGLEPGNLGHCYYVPFNNKKKDGSVVKEVQFILGYRGIVELVNRAGKAVILSTEVVYEGDHFKYAQGLNPVLKHIPCDSGERGDIKGVYCVAKNIVAQEKLFVYLSRADIDKVKKTSKASKSDYSPWNTWYGEMAKKTAVKRICKLLPLSIEVQKQVSTDETTRTKIQKDMTMLPDETDWNGEETVIDVTPLPEMPPEAPESPVTDESGENRDMPPEKSPQGEFKPSSSDLKNTPEDVLRGEIGDMIGDLCKNDETKAPGLLQKFTAFGDFTGCTLLSELKATGKDGKRTQLEVTHSKVKKAWLEREEKVADIDVDAE